jgi:hypothetical protein
MKEATSKIDGKAQHSIEGPKGVWLRFNFSDTALDPEKTIRIIAKFGGELVVGPSGFNESHHLQCHGLLTNALAQANVLSFERKILGRIVDIEADLEKGRLSGLLIAKDDISDKSSEEICQRIAGLWGTQALGTLVRSEPKSEEEPLEETATIDEISIGPDGVPMKVKEELNPDAIREAEESGFKPINLDTLVDDIKKRRALHERLEREDQASAGQNLSDSPK